MVQRHPSPGGNPREVAQEKEHIDDPGSNGSRMQRCGQRDIELNQRNCTGHHQLFPDENKEDSPRLDLAPRMQPDFQGQQRTVDDQKMHQRTNSQRYDMEKQPTLDILIAGDRNVSQLKDVCIKICRCPAGSFPTPAMPT